jgi:hypothetical protein
VLDLNNISAHIILLSGLSDQATLMKDSTGRLLIVRSRLNQYMVGLERRVRADAIAFAAEAETREVDIQGNNRGRHFASNMGIDRQNKAVCHITYYASP